MNVKQKGSAFNAVTPLILPYRSKQNYIRLPSRKGVRLPKFANRAATKMLKRLRQTYSARRFDNGKLFGVEH